MKLFEEEYTAKLDENAHKYITSANNAVKRMSLLITSLLTFSQLGSNKILMVADCNKVVENVLEDLQLLIKTSSADIEVSKLPTLAIYETEMHQLFQNLITNSIKFQKINERPQIKISAQEIEGKWQFSVSDNGIRIDAENYERIFDIFQRLHNKKEYSGKRHRTSQLQKDSSAASW